MYSNTRSHHSKTIPAINRLLLSVAVLLLGLAVLSGCQTTGTSTKGDPFLAAIMANYPDLEGHPYEIDSVKRVVDGDTFETESGNKVRLIGVNTPEVHGKVEYFGKEASQYTKEHLTNQKVYLFQDTGDTDRYGRLLRYVFIDQDPVMYNDRLVQEGYANTMSISPNVMYADHFVKLEREARNQNKGLWADASADTSDYNQPSGCAKPKIKGNINSKKDRIYHVPGGESYEQTTAEKMFCNVEEAEAAGFRKAAR
ncbi:thermonuclease family protein [Paenibacillus marinisediminis]